MRNLFVNLSLLLGSCVAGLALCEVSLRLFYPKYRHLAEAQFHLDAMRLWARTPNVRDWNTHADTFVPHSFHHNNLALRQHRNFRAADLAAATNIGVFGDSFTENVRLPVQYSFTEPLDYLLNQSGTPFNVLNFGVLGYGTGQSFLHYEHFRRVKDLDHVVYVYCRNDIWNVLETELFSLDESGHLVRNGAMQSSWQRSLIRRLHTSYLVLHTTGLLFSFIAGIAPDNEYQMWQRQKDRFWGMHDTFHRSLDEYDVEKGLKIFRQLIRSWKHLAERNGSFFYVVTLPREPVSSHISSILLEEDVEVIDLYACFGATDPAHRQGPWPRSPYRFKKDTHLNEAGNRLAAVCLYRTLAEKMGLPHLSESKLEESLFRYYAAFEGKIPEGLGGRAERSTSLGGATAKIREKYLALDMSYPLEDLGKDITELIAQPNKPIIRSVFDIYRHGNQLLYVKEDCRPADTRERFFLHVIPVDKSDLPKHRRAYGFDNRNFSQRDIEIDGRRCIVRGRLPAYPYRRIRTGQFVKDAQRNYVHLWEVEFSMDQASGVGEGGH